MQNLNAGRVGGCNAAAQSLDPAVLQQARQAGNRATRRAAQRNLRKLRQRSNPTQGGAAC